MPASGNNTANSEGRKVSEWPAGPVNSMTTSNEGLHCFWHIFKVGKVTLSSDICDRLRLSFSVIFKLCMIQVEMYLFVQTSIQQKTRQ